MTETLINTGKSVTVTRFNRLSIVSAALSAFALLSVFVVGSASFAIFAVGTGHIALQQIAKRGERGSLMAIVGLVAAYALGTWGLVSTVQYWIVAVQQAM